MTAPLLGGMLAAAPGGALRGGAVPLQAVLVSAPAVLGCGAPSDGLPRSARRGILEWVVQARTAPTRDKRVRDTVEHAARRERAHQWRRPRTPGPDR